MHTLCGPWSVAISMPVTPNERLLQVLGPPSAISLSLSAGTWEMLRCTPLPISHDKKPEDYVRLSLSGHSVSAFLFFCLCHSAWRRIVYDLLVFLILTQDEGEFASAFGSHIISLLYPSPGKNSLLRVPNATSNPLHSLLLCQHPQFTGEISEAQRGEHTTHDHTT